MVEIFLCTQVIVPLRDPRDTCVSFFEFQKFTKVAAFTWQEFVEAYVSK